jgi:hypothetical protein
VSFLIFDYLILIGRNLIYCGVHTSMQNILVFRGDQLGMSCRLLRMSGSISDQADRMEPIIDFVL